jgi:hypothetical protein
MRIAIYSLEPKYENTALMQISMFHKLQGDSVEWYSPLFHGSYDKIYCSSIFDYSPKDYVTSDMVCGGSGFGYITLPNEIAECDYDYSIYPNCTKSYQWFSRGCIRNCPLCVVPKIEGKIHSVKPKSLNPNGKVVYLMDPNFFANPEYNKAVDFLEALGQPVDFQQGVDARIFTHKHGEAINRLKIHKQVRTAWDNPKDDLTEQFELMKQYIPKYKLMCYVLVGYWSTEKEDLYRIETLKSLGIDPYVMPYNKKDPYQRHLARWINARVGCAWKDYKPVKKMLNDCLR